MKKHGLGKATRNQSVAVDLVILARQQAPKESLRVIQDALNVTRFDFDSVVDVGVFASVAGQADHAGRKPEEFMRRLELQARFSN